MRFQLLHCFFRNILLVCWTHGVYSQDDATPSLLPNFENEFNETLPFLPTSGSRDEIFEALQALQSSVNSLSERAGNSEALIEKLGQQVSSVQSGMTKMSDRLGNSEILTAHLSQYKYQPIITNCGGVFRIRPGFPIEIHYKNGYNYANYEFCVWSFVPDSPLSSYDFHLVQSIPRNNYDGIVMYAWNGDGVISVTKQTEKSHVVDGNHVFMAFESDGNTPRLGFIMRITARSAGSQALSFVYSAVSLQQSSGTYSLPNPTDQGRSEYVSNERISAVLQFSSSSEGRYVRRSTKVTSLNTEKNRDYLYAFPLKSFQETTSRTFHLMGFSGNYSSELHNLEMSTYTQSRGLLYLFESDGSTNGKGFSISWAPN